MFRKKLLKKNISLAEVNDILREKREEFILELKDSISNFTENERLGKMYKLGFCQIPGIEKYIKKKSLNISNQERLDLFDYYVENYPDCLFVNEEIIKRSCKLLGLFLGRANLYIRDIPIENMDIIKEFKIKDLDKYYQINIYSINIVHEYESLISGTRQASYDRKVEIESYFKKLKKDYKVNIQEDNDFYVLAPRDYFCKEALESANYKIRIACNDPVIFYECRGGYLKVTEFEL